MKPTNIEEFKALVNRYESITLGEVERAIDICPIRPLSLEAANHLTGFGSISTCTLCVKSYIASADDNGCKYCIYTNRSKRSVECRYGKNRKSYDDIVNSTTTLELFTAFKKRAIHLRKRYSKYL